VITLVSRARWRTFTPSRCVDGLTSFDALVSIGEPPDPWLSEAPDHDELVAELGIPRERASAREC
jgi:hypothetical protein